MSRESAVRLTGSRKTSDALGKTSWEVKMKRRFFAIAAVLALAAATFAHPAQAFTVTTTANSGAGSLSDAIDFANANPGTTIIFDGAVFPGVIMLTSRLPKITAEDTTIDGTGMGVTISGENLPNLSSNRGLRIRAGGTVIRELSFFNIPGDGIRIQPQGSGQTVTNVLIENNTFNNKGDFHPGSAADAIFLRGGELNNTVGVTISGNTIVFSTDDGIVVHGSFKGAAEGLNNVSVVIVGNTINHSQGAKNPGLSGDGIRVVSGCGDSLRNIVTAVISDNTVFNSEDQGILVKGSGCGNGVSSNNQMHADIYGNTVRTSGQGALQPTPLPPSQGIAVSGGDREGVTGGSDNIVTFTISNNIVSKSTKHGITVTGGGGTVIPTGGSHDVSGTISGNTVTTNDRRGININGGRVDDNEVHDVIISNNVVSKSREEGIRISGGSGDNNFVTSINIQGNTIRANLDDGISASVGSGSSNTVSFTGITNNTVRGNTGDGIRIRSGMDGGGATPISGNTASKNKEDGIDIDSIGYSLSNNRADRNTDDGINAIGNTNGGGNTAKGNADCNTPSFCF